MKILRTASLWSNFTDPYKKECSYIALVLKLHWLFKIKSCKITFGIVSNGRSVELENSGALTAFYVIFNFLSSLALFSCYEKWLSYLSYAISPYLHGRLINWTMAFLNFCCTVFPRILNILILMNRVVSIIWIFNYILFFFVCSFTSHGTCIDFDNQQIFY